MRLRRLMVLAAAWSMFAGGLVAADTSPLAQVPAEATVAVHLRGFEQVRERLKKLIKAAIPGADGTAASVAIEKGLQDLLGERELKGLPPDGNIFFVLTDLPRPDSLDELKYAAIVRVKDYKTFRDALLTEDERKALKEKKGIEETTLHDKAVFFVNRTDYAVVASHQDVAELFTRKTFVGLDSKLKKETVRTFLENDVAVHVNLDKITTLYADQIDSFRQIMELAMSSQATDRGMDKDMVEFLKTMLGAVFQVFRDSKGLLAAASFEPEGIKMHLELEVGPDTKTSGFLKQEKPVTLQALETLPVGEHAVFQATQPATLAIFQPLMRALAGELPSGQAKAMDEALKAQKAAKVSVQIAAYRDGYNTKGISISLCESPKTMVEAQLKMYGAMGPGSGLLNAFLAEKPKIDETELKHRGFVLRRIEVVYDLKKMAKLAMTDEEAMKKLMGQGNSYWVGTDGKVYVEVAAHDAAAAKAELDGYLDEGGRLKDLKAYKTARKNLPEKASMIALQESTTFTRAMAEGIAAAAGQAVPEIPKPARGKEEFFGMGLTLQQTNVAADIWFPAKAISAYYEIFKKLRPGGQ